MKSRTQLKRMFATLMVAMGLVGAMMALAISPSAAASVEPITVGGNPTCGSLASTYAAPGTTWIELKVDPGQSGTFTDGTLSVTIEVRDTADGPVFDWTSTIGVDSVFAKGGTEGGNLYLYDPPGPETTSDTGLHAPVNPSGKYAGLSHISFCYDIELQVSKTAETSFTRTFPWEIEKTVDIDYHELFTGESGTSEYTVTVTKGAGVDSDWAVSGTITIFNPASVAATITGVTDEVSGVGAAQVNCPGGTSQNLAAGATLVCTYSLALPDGANRTNTATVTTSGAVGGGSGSADVIFGDPTTLVNDTVSVEDSVEGFLGQISASDIFYYSQTFTCDEDEGLHENIATVIGDNDEVLDSDDVSVEVDCIPVVTLEGCTPGFWKNNLQNWGGSAFPVDSQSLVPGTSFTYAQALNMTGKFVPGVGGIYYAHLAAAYLNSLSGFEYAIPYDQIGTATQSQLAAANEAGCPINQQGQRI